MRVFVLLLLLAVALGALPSRSIAGACDLQNVRAIDGRLICIYNCNGKVFTLTRPGGACPVILEQ